MLLRILSGGPDGRRPHVLEAAFSQRGLAPALEESDQLMLASLGQPDFAEGVSAFSEKRPPAFAGISRETAS